jgi:hypothetical protein
MLILILFGGKMRLKSLRFYLHPQVVPKINLNFLQRGSGKRPFFLLTVSFLFLL